MERKPASRPRLLPLCLDCNYSLRGLAESRCPECGREFNIQDPTTFNDARPLRWIDRQLLKPIGWPMFTTIGFVCCWYLYHAFSPGFYYAFGFIIVTFLVLVFISLLLIGRSALRTLIPPRSIPRPKSLRRERLAFAMFGFAFLLVIFQVPLRILFFLAKPELDRVAQGIIDGSIQRPISSHRAGPIVISSANALYGDDDQYFFVIHGLDGGFAYCRTPGRSLYYNSGADGHLWGNWYWWIDD